MSLQSRTGWKKCSVMLSELYLKHPTWRRIFDIVLFIKGSQEYTDYHFDVDKELFIWSVITGRRNFNLLFWARGKNKICK
jgi:hypothetical protein